ncbi:MAG TPA: tetratricopeptide repeat protein, partial [Candidatus Obscuribacterales bacterium]
ERYVQQGAELNETPEFALLISRYGDCLAAQKNYKNAREAYEEAIKRWQKLGDYDNRAIALVKLGDLLDKQKLDASQPYEEAIRLLKEHSSKPEALLAIAEKHYADHLWRKANLLGAVALKLEYSRLVSRMKTAALQ